MTNRAEAVISLRAIKQNIDSLMMNANNSTKALAVIKADAYGHGAVSVAKYLNKNGINNFAVACAEEGEELRRVGIEGMILVLGKTAPENADKLIEFDLSQACDSVEYAEAISKHGCVKIHIKIDTGMSRLGFYCHNQEDIGSCAENISQIFRSDNILVEGIFTHFADTDSESFTTQQYSVFKNLCDKLISSGFNIGTRHCCNSAATAAYPNMHLDMVRLGIGLYGLERSVDGLEMHPAMSVHARIATISKQLCGDTVSYGRTYKIENEKTVAVVSFGYADGMPRLLSNRYSVTVNSIKAPIIGRICMDMFMIDVTDIDCKEGDAVVIFGNGGEVNIIADTIGTINYEIVCGISKRVPRKYTEE